MEIEKYEQIKKIQKKKEISARERCINLEANLTLAKFLKIGSSKHISTQ